jgi:hypothetical protein
VILHATPLGPLPCPACQVDTDSGHRPAQVVAAAADRDSVRTFASWVLVTGLGSAGCRRISRSHGGTSTAGDNTGGVVGARSTLPTVCLTPAIGSG